MRIRHAILPLALAALGACAQSEPSGDPPAMDRSAAATGPVDDSPTSPSTVNPLPPGQQGAPAGPVPEDKSMPPGPVNPK